MKYLKILSQSKAVNADYGYLPYILVIISNVFYPLTWIYCNQQDISMAQNSMVRGLVGTAINVFTCYLTSSPTHIVQEKSYRLLVLRSVIMSVYSGIIGLSQFILPLPVVHTINSSGSIFVFIIDYFVNGIKINSKQTVGIVIGFIGVLIAGNGKLIMSWIYEDYQYETKFKHYITHDPIIISAFTLLFIIMMFCWAYGVVLTKRIHANTFQINIVMSIIIFFTGAIIFPFTSNKANYTQLILAVLLTGIPLNVCQLMFIGGLTMTKNTGLLTIIGFTSIAVSYLVSVLRYHESLNFIVIFGIIFVFFGVWRAVFTKDKIN